MQDNEAQRLMNELLGIFEGTGLKPRTIEDLATVPDLERAANGLAREVGFTHFGIVDLELPVLGATRILAAPVREGFNTGYLFWVVAGDLLTPADKVPGVMEALGAAFHRVAEAKGDVN